MAKIKFIDTTLRDGQQSLWALNMTTEMILPILEDIDKVGYDAIEFCVPQVQMKKMVREQRKNPWHLLEYGIPKVKNTRLRLHGAYTSGFTELTVPESVRKLLVQIAIDYGLTAVRCSDYWNDFENMSVEIETLKTMGLDVIINFTYTVSPRHTDEYFISRARDAAKTKPFRICFKDVGGLLTPEVTNRLLPKIIDVVGGIPIEFHGHCNNSLGPFNALEAVKNGIDYIHTAIPPLANGSSLPSIYNVAKNVESLGYEHGLDLSQLKNVEKHFRHIARVNNFPVGVPVEYDESLYDHQVPGGMISNLRYQLSEIGMEHLLEKTLDESTQVRAEFGYPIMITPLSQFVSSQAAINVLVGERYKIVTDEVIQYALGLWGREAVEFMDKDVRDLILDRPRADEIKKKSKPADVPLEEVRKKHNNKYSDEELVMLYYIGEEAIEISKNAKPPSTLIKYHNPLIQLMHELSLMNDRQYISIAKKGVSLQLAK